MKLRVGRWMELFSLTARWERRKASQMNVTPAGGGKRDVLQSQTITQSLNNWDHRVVRRYPCGPRASNPSSLSRLHPWAELKDMLILHTTPSVLKRLCSSLGACQTSSQRGWEVHHTFTLSRNHFWWWTKILVKKKKNLFLFRVFFCFSAVCSFYCSISFLQTLKKTEQSLDTTQCQIIKINEILNFVSELFGTQ